MPKIDLPDLIAPGRTALVLQEVQEGVVGESSGLPALAQAAAEVDLIGHVRDLSAAARAVRIAVVHCTAENLPDGFGGNRNARLFAGALKAGLANVPGSPAVQPVEGINAAPTDVVLPRYHGLGPMTGSPLDSLLRNSGITTVVVVGVSLNLGIPNLVFDAVNRSYQVVIPVDAVAGTPAEYGHQVLENSLRLVATLTTTAEIISTWSSLGSDEPVRPWRR